MKKLISLFVVLIPILLTSCESSIRKEYGSCNELIDNIIDAKYDNLVNVWGEPDQITPNGIDIITLTWNNDKLNIKGQSETSINFTTIAYKWSFHDNPLHPFRVKSVSCGN